MHPAGGRNIAGDWRDHGIYQKDELDAIDTSVG